MSKKLLFLFVFVGCIGFHSDAQSAGDFYKRAVAKYNQKDYAGAIIEYTRAIEIKSDAAVLYNNRGVCKFKLQRYSDAIQDYEKALKYDEKYVHAYFNKGNSYMGILEYENALIAYDKTLGLDKKYSKAYINRAKVFFQLGDYKSSIEDIEYAMQFQLKKEQRQKLYLSYGNCLMKQLKYNDAVEKFSKAIQINTEYYKAYVNRGQCYLKMKDYESAIRDYNVSMKYDPLNGAGYYYRGLVRIDQVSAIKSSSKNKKSAKQFKENEKLLQLACSDFKKATELSYGPAFEAQKTYCK
ncbi:MAG: tetratricopeptide repeat protein [Bacteroidia bacterium]